MAPAAGPKGPSQGRRAEDSALEFLQRQGLKLLERNYRSRYGEIDLIMEHGRSVVFVEVRFRGSARFGGALESVDGRKQARLVATAACFLKDRRLDRPTRFDVAALSPGADGLAVEWVQDAFQAD
jgi:putative endonuclease